MKFTTKTTEDGRTLYCPEKEENATNKLESIEVIHKAAGEVSPYESLGVKICYGGVYYGDYIKIKDWKLDVDTTIGTINDLLKRLIDNFNISK